MQKDIPLGTDDFASNADASTPPPYIRTIGDIQQYFGRSGAPASEDLTSAVDEQILHNIIVEIGRSSRRKAFLVSLVLLPLVLMTAPFSCVFIICAFHYSEQRPRNLVKDGIRHTIHLEGDQWSRYLEHFYNLNSECLGNQKSVKQRVIARGYGHVLFGPSCLFIDELKCMGYENTIAGRTELVKAPNGVDMMLRIWFCRRVYANNINNDPYSVDIFLPTHMTTDELSAINNYILNESKCRPLFGFNNQQQVQT
jgi:hypothetical protein